jgi:hypothetical protein
MKTEEFLKALKEICSFETSEASYGSVSMSLFKVKNLPYYENLVRETLEQALISSKEHSSYSISQTFTELYPQKLELLFDEDYEVAEKIDDIWYQYSTFCTHMLPQSATNQNELITEYPNNKLSIECVKGLPYGGIARIIILYINSMAVKYRSKEVEIGSSIKEFVEKLGYKANYQQGAINDQVLQMLEKLFHTTFVLTKIDKAITGDGEVIIEQIDVRFHFFDSKVTLEQIRNNLKTNSVAKVIISDGYFKEILAHPVPLSFEAIKSLKKSPLALDLYAFIAYRANGNKIVAAKLSTLKKQFAFDGPTWRFKENVERALHYVHKAWPEGFKVILKNDVLLIPKMSTHIAQSTN